MFGNGDILAVAPAGLRGAPGYDFVVLGMDHHRHGRGFEYGIERLGRIDSHIARRGADEELYSGHGARVEGAELADVGFRGAEKEGAWVVVIPHL